MKFIPTLLTMCALLLPRALPAETFAGKVTMKMTFENSSDSAKAPASVDFYMKEGYMKMVTQTQRGEATMIMDLNNRQMIILIPQMQKYMVQPIPQPSQEQVEKAKAQAGDLKVTSSHDTILGYDCTEWIYTDANGNANQIWVTDQLGSFYGMSPGGGGPGRAPSNPMPWESALKGHGGFPLRVVGIKNGKPSFRMDVTGVEKMNLTDADFSPPAGYEKFEMPSFMKGMMPGGGGN